MPVLDYTTGDGTTYDDGEVINDMKAKGFPVVGQTADGLNAVVQKRNPAKGEEPTFQIPLQTYLQNQGEQVSGVKPKNPGKDYVDPWLSTGVQKFDDPDMKKAYIQNSLHKAHGIKDAQVIGSGNEMHVWDPDAGQWQQVTEEPKWNNKTGWMSAALALPHLVGMASGGATGAAIGAPLGALGGPAGAIAGGLGGAGAGAALGSGLGEALTERGMGMLDPAFDETLDKYPGKTIGEIGSVAGRDALAEMGGQGIGLGLKALMPGGAKAIQSLAEEGQNVVPPMPAPLSKTAQALGSTAEGLGGGARAAAGALARSPAVTEALGQFVPSVGQVIQGGEIAQAPQAVIRGIGNMAAKADQWAPSKYLLGDSAKGVGEWGRAVTEETAPANLADKINKATQNVAGKMGRVSEESPGSAKNILHNVANRLANKTQAEEAWAADPIEQSMANSQTQVDREFASQPGWGLKPEEINDIANESRAYQQKAYVDRYLADTGAEPNWGTDVGRAVDTAGNFGRQARNVGVGALGLGLRGIQGAGAAAQAAGFGLRNAATLAEPLELPASLRYGIPTLDDWWRERNR
jgi:hypothetical protein